MSKSASLKFSSSRSHFGIISKC